MTQRHFVQNDAIALITIVTADRCKIFADPAIARETIETLYRVQALRPFFLYGFVIMPDHIHLLMYVPYPQNISLIVGTFKRNVRWNTIDACMWQKRFHMRIVHNAYAALRYVHANPCKAGIVEHPEDYPWSSASGKWDVSDLPF